MWVRPAAFWAQMGAMTEGHFPPQGTVAASADLERMAKVEATVKVTKIENFIFFWWWWWLRGEKRTVESRGTVGGLKSTKNRRALNIYTSF